MDISRATRLEENGSTIMHPRVTGTVGPSKNSDVVVMSACQGNQAGGKWIENKQPHVTGTVGPSKNSDVVVKSA